MKNCYLQELSVTHKGFAERVIEEGKEKKTVQGECMGVRACGPKNKTFREQKKKCKDE